MDYKEIIPKSFEDLDKVILKHLSKRFGGTDTLRFSFKLKEALTEEYFADILKE